MIARVSIIEIAGMFLIGFYVFFFRVMEGYVKFKTYESLLDELLSFRVGTEERSR